MKMKARTATLIALLVCALLVSGIALAQGGGGGQPNAVALSGGRYRLVGTSAQAGVIASGGEYRLLPALWFPSTRLRAGDTLTNRGTEGGPASPSGGNPCCCTYLPCVLRSH